MEVTPANDAEKPLQIRPTRREYEYFITSETGEGEYQLMFVKHESRWKCTCMAFRKSDKPCKHIHKLMEYLAVSEGGREPEEEDHIDNVTNMVVPEPPKTDISRWVKQIHGRDFITYEGLLNLAHERGLQELGAYFVEVTTEKAIARARAKFADGREFWEAADATPNNVNAMVKAHFPRIALTRAKARVLRDALNIAMIAIEELEE